MVRILVDRGLKERGLMEHVLMMGVFRECAFSTGRLGIDLGYPFNLNDSG